ncbi:MAG: MFS transporter [Spirochaetia bacterium]
MARHEESVDTKETVSLKTKLAYGAGDMGAGITATIEAFVFLVFLTNVAGLPAGIAGTVLLVGRIWDAINDPIVGFLSDRTRGLREHTKLPFRRRHSWMIIGSIPFGLTFFLLWFVPEFSQNQAANQTWLFIYYTAMFILFDTAYTAVNLPYTALTPEITKDYDQRTKLTSFRFAFSIGGSVLALALGSGFSILFPEPGQKELQYIILGAVCAVLSVLPIYWCVWGTKEEYNKKRQSETPWKKQIITIITNKPFLFVIAIYLFSWLAFQLTSAIIPYYVKYWIGVDQFFQVALVVQVSAACMLFIWSRISDKLGKKGVYFIGMTIWIAAQIGLFFLNQDQIILMYIFAILAGCGVAIAYLIPWSMLPDVIDLDELRTGERREGIFYSFMILFQKAGLGLGVFIAGIALDVAGFVEASGNQQIPEQPETALTVIRIIAGPVPGLLLIGGIVLTFFYPITRKIHTEHINKLEKQ